MAIATWNTYLIFHFMFVISGRFIGAPVAPDRNNISSTDLKLCSSTKESSMKVLILNFPPFAYQNSANEFDGIDIRILQTITKKLNLTFTIQSTDNIDRIDDFSNFDLIIGGLSMDAIIPSMFVQSSFYMQDEITWCVRHAKPIKEWRRLFNFVRDYETHILGSISIFLVVTGIYLFSAFERRPYDFLEAASRIAQAMTGVCSFAAERRLFQIHICLFQIVTILTATHFNAFFVQYLVGAVLDHQIQTLDELKINHFHLAVHSIAAKHLASANLFSDEEFQRIETCDNLNDCLDRLRFDDRFAIAISRRLIQSSSIQNEIFCFDSFHNRHLKTFMIREEFEFRKEFNDILHLIIDSGLVAQWEKDFRYIRIKETFYSTTKPLKLSNYIFFYIIPCVAGALSLILECIIARNLCKENRHRFWKLAERLIDGRRHFFLLENTYH